MSRQFFTAIDIQQLSQDQKTTVLYLGFEDVVTQEAEELAEKLGIRLVRRLSTEVTSKTMDSSTGVESAGLPPLKVIHRSSVSLESFSEGMASPGTNVRLKDVITSTDGAPLAAGYMALDKGEFRWELTYDEVDIVLEGDLVIRRGLEEIRGSMGDLIFIPKNSSITFASTTGTKFVYVVYPADWNL